MSVDGHIDDASATRLILSSDEDLDRVDELRAACDAILVGAATVRRDDPRLLVRSASRRAERAASGLPESPAKVTVTIGGDLSPAAQFFTAGSSARLVYCARAGLALARARLSNAAEVIDAGDIPTPAFILTDLARRGVTQVLLEGGGQLASAFLTAGLADELHLVVAPFFVGDDAAPRFASPGNYPNDPAHRMQLAELRPLGDVVLLRYLLATRPVPDAKVPGQSPRTRTSEALADHIRWLRQTIKLLEDDDSPVPELPGQPASWAAGPAADGYGDGAGQPSGDGPGEAGSTASASGPGGPAGEHGEPLVPGPVPVDIYWLRQTIELAKRCPPSATAFSVGAAVVAVDGTLLATGYSRERDLRDHAEEVALSKIHPGDPRLAAATIYSSLEPCGVRASRPRPCADLIIAAGIPRVVYAWHEPPILAVGGGTEMLRSAGLTVIEASELASEARAVNAHLAGPAPRPNPPVS
jgi:5-amino-6-(5-phosphoribosylamino)uracil reductase